MSGEYFEWLRARVGHDMILMPGTGAIVLDDAGRLLLMRRADSGDWGLPGGFMDLGETVADSLRRELREELGIDIESPRLVGAFSGPSYVTTHPNGDRTTSVTILFEVQRWHGSPRDSEESDGLEFFSPDELPEPLRGSHRTFIEAWRAWVEGGRRDPIVE